MTQLNTDMTLRCGFQGLDKRAVRLFTTALVALLMFAANAANAQVRLENKIKKVETFVNDAGAVERRLVDANSVVPGDELQYTVHFTNDGDHSVDASTIVITDVVPAHTQYLEGTAYGSGTQVRFSVDGEMFADPAELRMVKDGVEVAASAKDYHSIRWMFSPALEPGASGYVTFNVRLK